MRTGSTSLFRKHEAENRPETVGEVGHDEACPLVALLQFYPASNGRARAAARLQVPAHQDSKVARHWRGEARYSSNGCAAKGRKFSRSAVIGGPGPRLCIGKAVAERHDRRQQNSRLPRVRDRDASSETAIRSSALRSLSRLGSMQRAPRRPVLQAGGRFRTCGSAGKIVQRAYAPLASARELAQSLVGKNVAKAPPRNSHDSHRAALDRGNSQTSG